MADILNFAVAVGHFIIVEHYTHGDLFGRVQIRHYGLGCRHRPLDRCQEGTTPDQHLYLAHATRSASGSILTHSTGLLRIYSKSGARFQEPV